MIPMPHDDRQSKDSGESPEDSSGDANLNKKLYTCSCRIISYITIVLLGLLTLFSLISTTFVNSFDQVFYISDKAVIHAVFIIAVPALLWLLHDRLHFRVTDKVLIIALILITVFTAVYIALADLPPRFDQRVVRSIAANLIVGIPDDFSPGAYGAMYPNNHGIILFYYLLMKFAGYENYIVMQYANLAFMVLTEIALYLILKRLVPYYREASLGLILFMPFWGFSTFLYGNIPGFCLFLWGVFFGLRFLGSFRLYDAVLAGLFLAAGCRFKENMIIFMIAFSIVILCEMLKSRKIKNLLIILSFFIFLTLGRFAMDKALGSIAGYSPEGGMPGAAFIAMGMHEHEYRGAGWFDDYTVETYESSGHDAKSASETAKEDIKGSIDNFKAHPSYMAGFYIRKTASVWNEPAYYSWTLQQGRNASWDEAVFLPGINIIYMIFNRLQTILYLFALYYFIRHRKDTDIRVLIFAIFFIGGFFFHLLWEAGSQYALFYAMTLSVYAVCGMMDCCRMLKSWDKKKKTRAALIVLCAGLILTIPVFSSALTLSRDNARFKEYISAPY